MIKSYYLNSNNSSRTYMRNSQLTPMHRDGTNFEKRLSWKDRLIGMKEGGLPIERLPSICKRKFKVCQRWSEAMSARSMPGSGSKVQLWVYPLFLSDSCIPYLLLYFKFSCYVWITLGAIKYHLNGIRKQEARGAPPKGHLCIRARLSSQCSG